MFYEPDRKGTSPTESGPMGDGIKGTLGSRHSERAVGLPAGMRYMYKSGDAKAHLNAGGTAGRDYPSRNGNIPGLFYFPCFFRIRHGNKRAPEAKDS